ncbi:MAG: peptide chain release factor N(5)-glutamine methyltransferase [Lachnospiraceae bacterium]|nr:peptide chain release factor N(5)-glutamine methyltransferase [Lachnospiraceae bacterium]
MTLRELYLKGKRELIAAGKDEAEPEARLLLQYACDIDKNTLFMQPDKLVTTEAMRRFDDCLQKRKASMPLQYILGTQGFMGMELKVTPDVLIPRSDTEVLVEQLLSDGVKDMSVLDLCTGSGCILLGLMKNESGIKGTGADISEKALNVARENAKIQGVSAEWVVSDLYGQITGSFDVITSNPPYIRTSEIELLMPEVGKYEPRTALDGGADGLDYYRRIVKDAPKYLNPEGRIYLEIGSEQGAAVKGMLEDNGFKEVRIIRDYARLDRVVTGKV